MKYQICTLGAATEQGRTVTATAQVEADTIAQATEQATAQGYKLADIRVYPFCTPTDGAAQMELARHTLASVENWERRNNNAVLNPQRRNIWEREDMVMIACVAINAIFAENAAADMHTLKTAEEAIEETEKMLNVYTEFCQKELAIPVVQGMKTESDKFAGAERTYCIEALMHDGKALQAGTSHYFGDGFAKAFEIQYSDKENKLVYPHQTSWGMTTRLIGAIIMTHGDNNGLVLPPAVAPIQVIVVPVAQHKEGVLEKANEICDRLKKICRAKIDASNNTPGWKFAEYEMKGVPIRLEIGPKDIENNQCVIVTRHNREKTFVSLDELEAMIPQKLEEVRNGIYSAALENRERRTYICNTLDEITKSLEENGDGFVKAMWCGNEACEDKVKEVTGVGSRCIPLEQEQLSDTCVCCGKPAKHMLYWGKAY